MNISRRNQAHYLRNRHGLKARISLGVVILLLSMWPILAFAVTESSAEDGRSLDSINVTALPGNKVQIKLKTSGAGVLETPKTFTTGNPARIALDLANTTSTVAKRQKVGIGVATTINAIESKGRTRIVMNLTQLVPYEVRVDGGDVYVIIDSDARVAMTQEKEVTMAMPVKKETIAGAAKDSDFSIRKIDFRRDDQGAGRVIVSLSDPNLPIDINEERGRVIINFINTRLPSELEQRLDVLDFATPVRQIDTYQRGRNTQMIVAAEGRYEQLTYQADDQLTIEVRPVVEKEQEEQRKRETGYVGDKLTLNFQDIEVRAVLQLIADFTGLNMVTSDTVKGNVTLRLKNVPWDQALDLILQTKGLDMRKYGNVIMVAPSEELAAREKQEFESQKQISELAPTFTDQIQINYAKADEIASLLKAEGNTLLSERGSVSTDERTNTLLVQDTAEKLDEIKKVVAKLDIPIRQVLIESRVVIANDDFSKELGSRFGVQETSRFSVNGQKQGVIGISGAQEQASIVTRRQQFFNRVGPFDENNALDDPENVNDRLNVNLPVIGNAGRFAMAIIGNDYMLDLELSAMQAEGRGEVVSSPRVITSNQSEAVIRQGVEVPYQQASSSGATNVAFKSAVLELKVTPQITPDDRVIMDLAVSKDSVGDVTAGIPSINTRNVKTQVLVNNGETVVIGGIYEQIKSEGVDKIPLFGDIPVLGVLFRHKYKTNDKAELLVFVTPKVLKESLSASSSNLVTNR